MKTKWIVAGIIAAVAGFGIGIGIPLVSNAGFEVSSYEQAQAIMNNASAAELAKLNESTSDNTDAINDGKGSESADETEGAVADEAAADNEASADTTDTVGSDEDAVNEEIADRDIEIDDKTVVLDWDYLNWAISGVKLADPDFDTVLSDFGISPNTVEYTDSGFEFKYEDVYNGKKASVYYDYRDDDDVSVSVYYDGESYVDEMLDPIPADKNINKSFNIYGDAADENNSWYGHWNFYYSENRSTWGEVYNSFFLDNLDADDFTKEAKDEMAKHIACPFLGGTKEEFEAAVKLDEMLDKGLVNKSESSEDYTSYIVKTNLGKCRFVISTYESRSSYWDGEQQVEEAIPMTDYRLEFGDNTRYEMSASFADGSDTASQVYYQYDQYTQSN